MQRLPRSAAWILGFFFATTSANAAVVFSEIMYKGVDADDGTDGDLFEYIELYNNGVAPESLAGATFTKGITYTFSNAPALTLGPGDYLVIAKDRGAFQSRYPDVTNLAPGVYSGKLANDGEQVALRLTNGATESVTYGVGGMWPAAPYAFGPSLERYCLTAAGSTSVNWGTSGVTTNWIQICWTGRVHAGTAPVVFFLDYDGKCLVDDVSVRPLGSTNELVTNGSFEDGDTGWAGANNHARSRVEQGLGTAGSAAMVIQCNEARSYVPAPVYSIDYYGDAVSNRIYSEPVTLDGDTDYVLSCKVRRVEVSGKLYGTVGGVTNVLQLGSLGTPGRANTVGTSFLPIGLVSVTHASNRWPVGSAMTVQARVSTPEEVAGVSLSYRTVRTNTYRYTDGSYSNIPMQDDGMDPDLVAGDGLYAATIPAVTSNWTLVRYHVIATATNGFAARSPTRDDPETDYGYWVESTSPQTQLPNWHMLVDGNPIVLPASRHICAISPEGQIFTDILSKHRGNPESDPTRTGVGIHCHRTEKFNAWFAPQQKKINIRHRRNDWLYYFRRVVAEPLAYDLQRTIGLPTPRLRHICVWINGAPTITTELEAPEDAFLTGNGLDLADFLTRQSYSDGIEYVGGDTNLDNFAAIEHGLEHLASSNRNEYIRTNLVYESIQHSFALLSVVGNGDQDFSWNMFQHRDAADGRWQQFPWDVDLSFDLLFTNEWNTLTTLHPYYRTPLHPSIWDTNYAGPLTLSFFYPESNDVTTLPYRYRQQTTLWRYYHTLFTTNYLFPKLDALYTNLAPAYAQISAYETNNNPVINLGRAVTNVKTFIALRRDYYMNADWSDKRMEIWNPTNVYNPSNVVISEIMHSPTSGGKYIELFNRGPQYIDLSHWSLQAGSYTASLPFGVMLAPTSYLVIAGSEPVLTNAYRELGNGASMVERYRGMKLWDWPIVFTTATEYASRVVEMAGFDVPSGAGAIQLRDVRGCGIDAVSYTNSAPWPDGVGVAIERIDPFVEDSSPAAWRESSIVGTPGVVNAASGDLDADALPDLWESSIVAASSGLYTNCAQVLASDDFDGDGVSNWDEFLLGTNPTVPDDEWGYLDIQRSAAGVVAGFPTIALTGPEYVNYQGRFYTLIGASNGACGVWSDLPGCTGLPAGDVIHYTNAPAGAGQSIGVRVELRPLRP